MRAARTATWALAAAAVLGALPASGAELLADPTRPPPVRAAPSGAPAPVDVQWRLAMVRVSGAARSAVLNGTLVREGDVLGGFRVERIADGSVTLESAGRRTVVAIADGSLKRPSTAPGAPAAPPALKQSAAAPLRGNASTGEAVVDVDRGEAHRSRAKASTTRTGK